MKKINTNSQIAFIGVNDYNLDLFESQYPVPNGMSYNSYVIMDEKIAIMDTVDMRATDQWLENLNNALNGKTADYLIVSHMEPDHSANIQMLALRFPTMQLVCSAKAAAMMPQFFSDKEICKRCLVVKEGETLSLGTHTLQFFMAPMVHWPEVMVTYEQSEKILFSADAFGKFGTTDTNEDWTDEARRYYYNICGKYGVSTLALLKKANTIDINTICPLHGPIINENIGYYIEKYEQWGNYKAEVDGVMIAYASIHGNTKKAALELEKLLTKKGINTLTTDLTRADQSQAVADAFRYPKLILAASSYDAGIFPPMEHFLLHLKSKAYQNRTVGIIENGSWAPVAGKQMRAIIEPMKNIQLIEPLVSIRSALNDDSQQALLQLAENIAK